MLKDVLVKTDSDLSKRETRSKSDLLSECIREKNEVSEINYNIELNKVLDYILIRKPVTINKYLNQLDKEREM